jgi:hypothetical protein
MNRPARRTLVDQRCTGPEAAWGSREWGPSWRGGSSRGGRFLLQMKEDISATAWKPPGPVDPSPSIFGRYAGAECPDNLCLQSSSNHNASVPSGQLS